MARIVGRAAGQLLPETDDRQIKRVASNLIDATRFSFVLCMIATLVTSNLPSTMTETLVSERLIGARMSARWLWRSDDRHNGDNYRRKSPAPKWTKPFS